MDIKKIYYLILIFGLLIIGFSYSAIAIDAPSVTTNDAEGILEYNATINGSLDNDGGENCNVWFEIGNTTSYGNNSVNVSIPASSFYHYISINEQQTDGTLNGHGLLGGDFRVAQSFTPGTVGSEYNHTIYSVKLKMKKSGGIPGTVNVTIRESLDGYIFGYATLDGNSFSASYTWYEFTFNTPVKVNYSTVYYLQASSDAGSIYWAYNGENYTGGQIYDHGGGTWWGWSARDLTFDFPELLSPGQFMHYRIVANNSNSTVYGSDKGFITKPLSAQSFEAETWDESRINLSWTKGTGSNNTYIERNLVSSWNLGEGTIVYNGTSTLFTNDSLSPSTTYYYQAWAYSEWSDDGTNYFQYSRSNVNSYNTTSVFSGFNLSFPYYLDLGEYIFGKGTIKNSTGAFLDGFVATTSVYNSDGVLVLPHQYDYCEHGEYEYIASTTTLPPGIYNISVNFLDQSSGYTYFYNQTLYLSYATPPGSSIYSNSVIYINFYNTNEGLGLPRETLKIYVDGTRLYGNSYYSYIGNIINLTIKDYYNTTLYGNNFTLNESYQFIDLGLTFHSYKFCNLNNEYYMISFLKEGGARWYERGVCPYETVEFILPSGNYSLRIYDSDNITLFDNSSIKMRNSRLYVLNGSYLQLMINGQSVITGQLLELSSELYQATMPDIVNVVCDIPSTYSIFEKEGAVIGTKLVCPALFVIGETTNTTTINSTTTFYPFIPESDTNNGTITVKEDHIYFEGNYSAIHWVNVVVDGVATNYSYVPNHIELFGENVAVSCNTNITIKRYTTYQQLKKFYWTKYTDTEYYTATITANNPLNTVLRHVFVIIEYANDTTPDYYTTDVYDVTNGVYMTRGENFDTSSGAIHFELSQITANANRSFTCSYYAVQDTTISSDAIVNVNTYSLQAFNDKNYWYLKGQYVNRNSDSFVGTLTMKFNFSMDEDIAPHSINIYDQENNVYLSNDEFALLGNGIQIRQNSVGTVIPNGVRTFEVYFLFNTVEDDAETTPNEIKEQAESILMQPFYGQILYFHAIMAFLGLCAIIIYYIHYDRYRSLSKEYMKKTWVASALILLMFFIYIRFMQLTAVA